MRDTSAEALQIQVAAIRRISPVERLRRAFELSEAMRELRWWVSALGTPGRSEPELVQLLVSGSPLPS